MGFNFGAFAGGAADGYRKENADLRAQKQQKMVQDNIDKQQAAETKRTAIFADAANNDKARRLIADGAATDQTGTQPANNAASGILAPETPDQSVTAPPAAQGITPSPASTPPDLSAAPAPAASYILAAQGIAPAAPVAQPYPTQVDQSAQPVSLPAAPIAAQGIGQSPAPSVVAPAASPSQQAAPAAAKQPVYRPATLDDSIAHSGEVMNKLMDAGLLEDAAKVAPLHNAMIAEKLQSETAQRENAARNFIGALNGGDDKALLATGQTLTGMIPDGNQLTAINRQPDGTFSLQYGNGAPVTMTADQLTTTAAGAVDFKTALSHIQQVQTNALAAAKAKQEADSNKIDQTERSRHNLASEGIQRISANKTSASADAPTAEMKNAKAFFPDLPLPDALTAFRKITADKGDSVHPDAFGGALIANPTTGKISRIDRKGAETILRPGGSQASANPSPAAEKPVITKAQVDQAAKAKGITDPAKLQDLYKTYGVN